MVRNLRRYLPVLLTVFLYFPNYLLPYYHYYAFIIVKTVILILQIIVVFRKGYTKVNQLHFLLIVYFILVTLSDYRTELSSFSTVMNCLCVIVVQCAIIIVIPYYINKLGITKAVEAFLISTTIIVCINAISVWVPGIRTAEMERLCVWWLSGKFPISYMHIMWFTFLAVYLELNNVRHKTCILIVALMINIMMTLSLNCMTGLIGSISIAVMIIFKNKFKKVSPYILFIFIGSLNIIFLSLVVIYGQSGILSSIAVFLGRDISFTGRDRIYAYFFSKMMSTNLLFGHGTNARQIVQYLTGCANSQNAFLQLILEHGLVGGTCFIVILLRFVGQYKHCKDDTSRYFLYGMIAMLICGLVEIPFSEYSFTFLIIFGSSLIIQMKQTQSIIRE